MNGAEVEGWIQLQSTVTMYIADETVQITVAKDISENLKKDGEFGDEL